MPAEACRTCKTDGAAGKSCPLAKKMHRVALLLTSPEILLSPNLCVWCVLWL